MRSIILLKLFLIPLFGFASFPIQISIPSDTIIEPKKGDFMGEKCRGSRIAHLLTFTWYKQALKLKIAPLFVLAINLVNQT